MTTLVPTTDADIAAAFPDLAAMEAVDLLAERKKLVGDKLAAADLSMDQLVRLSTICNLLRRKASGPPREKTPSLKDVKAKAIKSVDDLFIE